MHLTHILCNKRCKKNNQLYGHYGDINYIIYTCTCTGALIALAYALDRETIRRLNWRSIRVSKNNHFLL